MNLKKINGTWMIRDKLKTIVYYYILKENMVCFLRYRSLVFRRTFQDANL